MGAVSRVVHTRARTRTGAAAFGGHEAHQAPDGPAAMADVGRIIACRR